MMDLADFAQAFEDFGVLVVFGGQSTYAFLDTPDSVGSVGGFDVVAGGVFLKYATASLELYENDEILADGKRYKVRDVRAVDDGLLTVATVKAL